MQLGVALNLFRPAHQERQPFMLDGYFLRVAHEGCHHVPCFKGLFADATCGTKITIFLVF
jgi:hypothetical protein